MAYGKVKSNFVVSYEFKSEEGAEKKTNFLVGSTHANQPELEEVSLTNYGRMNALLKSGWEGIDVKNIADAKDNDPKNWVLILEKVS